MPALPSPYIARRQRRATISLVVLVLVTALLAGFGWAVAISPLVERLTKTYTETTAVVTDEGTVDVRTGSRRSRRTVERRTVTVEFTWRGSKHTATTRSDDAQIDEQVQVWVNDADPDEVTIGKPEGATAWTWIFAVLAMLVIAALVWAVVSAAQKLVAIAGFTPERAKGRLVLHAFNIADNLADPEKKVKASNVNRTISTRVAESTVEAQQVGSQINLTAKADAVPEPQHLGQQIEALVVRSGVLSVIVAARANGSDQQWWIAELASPSEQPKATQG